MPPKFIAFVVLWTLLLGGISFVVLDRMVTELENTQRAATDLEQQLAGVSHKLDTKTIVSSLRGAGDQAQQRHELSTQMSLSSLEGAGDEALRRQLLAGGVWGNVVSEQAASFGNAGCAYITADTTVDLSTKSCGSGNNQRCPLCWIITGGSGIDLQLENCDNAYYAENKQMDDNVKMVVEITVVNAGSGTNYVRYNGGVQADNIGSKKVDHFHCFSSGLNNAIGSLTSNRFYLNRHR